ncbi:MAG: type IX secretion system membrane protein PorP/SprF [Bacteroidia bacterium]
MKKILLFCLGLNLIFIDLRAQDPQLSQYYAASLYTNPAMAGASRNIRLAISGRSQYTGLQNNYKTGVAGLDAHIGAVNSGIGLLTSYDVSGDGFLTTTSASAIYAYNAQLNRQWGFNAAIQGGIIQKTYDFSKFVFQDMIDPVRGPVLKTQETIPLETRTIPNFSFGTLIFSNRLFAGAAIHNLLEPNQSFFYQNADSSALRLPRRYTVHGGFNIYLNKTRYEEDRIILSPNILFMQQRNFYQVNVGFYVKQKALTLGTWFRQTSKNADAAIFMIGMRFTNFKIGYSYDAVISKASTAAIGSHELSMVFEFKPDTRGRRRSSRALRCPDL